MWQYLKSVDSRELRFNFTLTLRTCTRVIFLDGHNVRLEWCRAFVFAAKIKLNHYIFSISGVMKWPKLNPIYILGHISKVMANDEWALFPWKVTYFPVSCLDRCVSKLGQNSAFNQHCLSLVFFASCRSEVMEVMLPHSGYKLLENHSF